LPLRPRRERGVVVERTGTSLHGFCLSRRFATEPPPPHPGGPALSASPRAAIFDLDGTLVDSVPDLAAALNRVLAEAGLPSQPLDAVARMVGHGVARLVERGFAVAGAPLDLAVLPRWVERFLHFYAEDLSTLTRPYPGVPEALDALLAAGWRLGVCTNKPTRLSVALLDALGLGPRFGAVVGGDAAPERKPHPAPLLMTLDRLGVPPAAAVFVGDSETDVLTARAAGLPVALVRHGYTAMEVESLGADAVVDDLSALPALLRSLLPAEDA
jgi:phosphoglycolate phosphatase